MMMQRRKSQGFSMEEDGKWKVYGVKAFVEVWRGDKEKGFWHGEVEGYRGVEASQALEENFPSLLLLQTFFKSLAYLEFLSFHLCPCHPKSNPLTLNCATPLIALVSFLLQPSWVHKILQTRQVLATQIEVPQAPQTLPFVSLHTCSFCPCMWIQFELLLAALDPLPRQLLVAQKWLPNQISTPRKARQNPCVSDVSCCIQHCYQL